MSGRNAYIRSCRTTIHYNNIARTCVEIVGVMLGGFVVSAEREAFPPSLCILSTAGKIFSSSTHFEWQRAYM